MSEEKRDAKQTANGAAGGEQGLPESARSDDDAGVAAEDEDLAPDRAVNIDEPDEDSPLPHRDEYLDPAERAKLEEASEDLAREETSPAGKPEIPPSRLDSDATKVIFRLRRFGHDAYLVGGCVRDLLLGLCPKDFDLASSARPEEMKAAFTNCRLIGRRFRLAHVYFRGGKVIETATFRKNPREEEEHEDSEESDLFISADNVYGSAEEDARRRDFTINALFYDPAAGRVLDFVGGRDDLEAGVVRTVGDPAVRMPEDPVRILRAVRFAAKLGFHIDEGTWFAMKAHAAEIPRCPPARITEEIFRLLRSGACRAAFVLLQEIGALSVILPPVAKHLESFGRKEEALFFALLDAVDEWIHEKGTPPDDAVLLAALLAPLFSSDGLPASRSEDLEALLSELVRTARLPRRVAERVRLIIGAQRVFAGQRKRRVSSRRFLRQAYVSHAMVLYDMRLRAYGGDYETYKLWTRRLDEQGTPADGRTSDGRKRRKRRKGSRRKR